MEFRAEGDTCDDGRQRRGTDAAGRFIERFAELLVAGGVARMPARVFAALMVSESGSLTAAELAERLQVSPAAVSGAVRYLTGVRMIERRRPLGARRDEYWLHDDHWYEMVMQRDGLLTAWSAQMKDGVATVGADTPAGRRMAVTAAFFDFLYDEMQALMDRWRQRRAGARVPGTDRARPHRPVPAPEPRGSLTCMAAPLVVWDPAMLGYRWSDDHPMNPLRLDLTMALATELGVLDGIDAGLAGARVRRQTLLTVHTADYIAAVRAASATRGRRVPATTTTASVSARPTTRSSRACTTPVR